MATMPDAARKARNSLSLAGAITVGYALFAGTALIALTALYFVISVVMSIGCALVGAEPLWGMMELLKTHIAPAALYGTLAVYVVCLPWLMYDTPRRRHRT